MEAKWLLVMRGELIKGEDEGRERERKRKRREGWERREDQGPDWPRALRLLYFVRPYISSKRKG